MAKGDYVHSRYLSYRVRNYVQQASHDRNLGMTFHLVKIDMRAKCHRACHLATNKKQ